MSDELITPVSAQTRQLLAANPTGVSGAPIVIFHGIADEAGRKLGGTLPLSVALSGAGLSASGKTPVITALTATGPTAAFTPVAGRNFNVEIRGTFVATVQLERSLDGGTNWTPLTAGGTQLYKWTAPASEVASETETTAQFRLNCTAFTSGTANTRISQ
jgi:hypothetical protein